MDCVNELLVKNCVPQEFELFLMKLFDQSFGLLQRLTNGIEGEGNDFARLDDRLFEIILISISYVIVIVFICKINKTQR